MFNIKIIKQIEEYKIYVIFFICFFILNCMIDLKVGSDDTSYLEIVNDKSIIGTIIHRVVTWQARIFSDFFQALMYKSMLLWSIINSLFLTICLVITEKIITQSIKIKNINYLRVALIGAFFSIYPYVITSAVLWYTGSFHYLWPFTMMLIALLSFVFHVYRKPIKNNLIKILILITTSFACYNEQTMAVLFVFGICSIIYIVIYHKCVYKFLIVQVFTIIINVSIYLFLDSYGNRGIVVYRFFPDFDMLNTFEKIYNGINFTHNHYVNSSNIITTIFFFMLLWVYNIKNNKFNISKFLVYIPFVYMLLNILPIDKMMNEIWKNNQHVYSWTYEINYARMNNTINYLFNDILDPLFYKFLSVNPINVVFSFSDLLPLFFSMSIMLFSIYIIFELFDNNDDRFVFTLILLATLISGYVNGFSPALKDSSSRVFFMGNMLFIILIGRLYSQIIFYYENLDLKCTNFKEMNYCNNIYI